MAADVIWAEPTPEDDEWARLTAGAGPPPHGLVGPATPGAATISAAHPSAAPRSYATLFGLLIAALLGALTVLILFGRSTVPLAVASYLLGAAVLAGGLAEVLLEQDSESAARQKAMSRVMALPAAFSAVGFAARSNHADRLLALAFAVAAIAVPVLLALVIVRRRVLATAFAACLFVSALVGLWVR